MMKIETKTKIKAQKNNSLKILKAASCIMSAQKWFIQSMQYSLPWRLSELSNSVVSKVGDSAPSWYLG